MNRFSFFEKLFFKEKYQKKKDNGAKNYKYQNKINLKKRKKNQNKDENF